MAYLLRLGSPARILTGCLLLLVVCSGCRGSSPQAEQARDVAAAAQAGRQNVSPPRILTQPRSVVMTERAPLILSVVADGIPAPTYQWTRDGVPVAGATGATLRLPAARAADAGTYRVEVTNAGGTVLSDKVAVAIEAADAAPTVTAPPQDLVVTAGAGATLNVGVSGTGPFTYAWTKEGQPNILSTQPTLWFTAIRPADSGFYTVEVTNRVGRATATCRVIVNPAGPIAPPGVAPTLAAPLQDLVIAEGMIATLKADVGGTGPFTYTWTREGRVGLVSTESTLWFQNARPDDSGLYTVDVRNGFGHVTATCRVTVNPR